MTVGPIEDQYRWAGLWQARSLLQSTNDKSVTFARDVIAHLNQMNATPKLGPVRRALTTKMVSILACGGLALFVRCAGAAAGDVYVGNLDSAIFKITPEGMTSTFATGFDPYGIAFNQNGELFTASSNQKKIIKVTANGTTSLATGLSDPLGVVFDRDGNLYVADYGVSTIVKIDSGGAKTNFASGIVRADGIAIDGSGNLFVTGFTSGVVTKITPSGTKSTLASGFIGPVGIACDAAGNVFVAERDGAKIARVAPNGSKSVFASTLKGPYGLAFDAAGNLYASEQFTGAILKFAPNGTKTTLGSILGEAGFLAVEIPTGVPLNISTRTNIGKGENILIAGFIITGSDPKKVMVRGIGPSLAKAGISNPLPDPTLEVHDAGGIINVNNNWKDAQASVVSRPAAR
jgi:hypothetical protein